MPDQHQRYDQHSHQQQKVLIHFSEEDDDDNRDDDSLNIILLTPILKLIILWKKELKVVCVLATDRDKKSSCSSTKSAGKKALPNVDDQGYMGRSAVDLDRQHSWHKLSIKLDVSADLPSRRFAECQFQLTRLQG